LDDKVKGGKPAQIIEEGGHLELDNKGKGGKPIQISEDDDLQLDDRIKGDKPIHTLKYDNLEYDIPNFKKAKAIITDGIDIDDIDDSDIDVLEDEDKIKNDKARVIDQENVSKLLIHAKNADFAPKIEDNIIAKHIHDNVQQILKEAPAHEWHQKDLDNRINQIVHKIDDQKDKFIVKDAIKQIIKETPLQGGWSKDGLIESVLDKVPSKHI
jgi:hypothetical protein